MSSFLFKKLRMFCVGVRSGFLVKEPLVVLGSGVKAGMQVVQADRTQLFHMWLRSHEFSIMRSVPT